MVDAQSTAWSRHQGVVLVSWWIWFLIGMAAEALLNKILTAGKR